MYIYYNETHGSYFTFHHIGIILKMENGTILNADKLLHNAKITIPSFACSSTRTRARAQYMHTYIHTRTRTRKRKYENLYIYIYRYDIYVEAMYLQRNVSERIKKKQEEKTKKKRNKKERKGKK